MPHIMVEGRAHCRFGMLTAVEGGAVRWRRHSNSWPTSSVHRRHRHWYLLPVRSFTIQYRHAAVEDVKTCRLVTSFSAYQVRMSPVRRHPTGIRYHLATPAPPAALRGRSRQHGAYHDVRITQNANARRMVERPVTECHRRSYGVIGRNIRNTPNSKW